MNEQFITMGIGLVVILLGAFNLGKALVRRRWPETIGKIQRNEVKTVFSKRFSLLRIEPLSNYSINSDLGTNKEVVLRLSYVYVVDGDKYLGRELFSAPVMKARSRIGSLVEGDKIKVFYNPNNPQTSFLAHSFSWPSIIVISIGAAISLWGGYAYISL